SYYGISVGQVGHAATDVDQHFEKVNWSEKFDRLCEVLDEVSENGSPKKTIVFANTKDAVYGMWAMKSWSMERFTEDFGHQKMICDWCFGLRLRLNDFAEYAATQADDDPLYLFDHLFGEYPATKSLLDEYQVPSVFGEDLLAGLGSLRPPYRWLLVGPRRSGSKVHQDPLGTSAWNALISGRCLTRRIDRPMACLRRHQRGGRLQGPRRSHRIETYGKDASIETYVARSFPRKAALLLLLDVGLAWTGNIFDRQESYGCFSLPKHPPRS
ncbi:Bifunctional arginine demethylase and lysyl-hydroxylase JMJD6 (Histone arginine demethylase JMJD6) (JmjC domain-containing protein 6) (Jumonji domain-containing protein 6) (Lysyl-hydroxylase JMJD6) (Peptide-lysine 5-dioxygenase JMJD6) (Phosphatidylserine receptor) (Protein PTDSR), partial [Durusdinium trenchii]